MSGKNNNGENHFKLERRIFGLKNIDISYSWITSSGELNHLPYLLSNSVSMAVIKDFSTNYMMALGLKQAYMLFKLHNKYCIVLICSFGSIKGNILQLKTKS